MYNCPACATQLRAGKDGTLWACPSCSGCTVRISVLRAKTSTAVVEDLWALAKNSASPSPRPCMACGRQMVVVSLPLPAGQVLFLDVCTGCSLVWFDSGELSRLRITTPSSPATPTPQGPRSPRLPPKGRRRSEIDEILDPACTVLDGIWIADALLQLVSAVLD